MTTPFIHLRVHTEYSIVDGIVRIKELVKQAANANMPAIAVTDHVNLFALVKLYRAAIAAGVKPIIGADVVFEEEEGRSTATLLCKNDLGYRHLTELISRAYTEGQKEGEVLIQWEWLKAVKEGLIVLSGARSGDVGQALLNGNVDQAKKYLQRWLTHFPNHYYLELQRTGREQEEEYLHAAVKLATEFQVPVVATNDVRFLKQEEFEAHEARVCIHDGYVLDDSRRPKNYSEEQYFKNSEQMHELFADIPEAINNTYEVARRCSVTLRLGTPCLPNFPVPEGMTIEEFFAQESRKGLQQRLQKTFSGMPDNLDEYEKRLQIELDVINKMGFPGYFLIVADFIRWSKENDVPVGPGRGSGAGSLVAYVLGITELDPLEHELLFERFLNPERVSMPDFDVDFCMEGRDSVIEYVARRYGQEAVSQIITYGTMAAKAVVRDVGRVLGMPYGFVDKIAKLIPFEIGMTLQKALAQEEALADRYEEEDEVQTLINLALQLEGITRNAGKHAGGVVIAPTKLTDFTPIYCEAGGDSLVTQFDKDDVEAVGLVKFDFLGLRTLTIINWALQTINKRLEREGKESVDIGAIPLDDKKTFDLLKQCATTAVFQLESRGMKELIRRLQPDHFEEITALVALFRPGPLQSGMVDDFIDRKHGRAKVNYPHPSLESILCPTYGVILYQEQVMQIAQVLSGYSLGGADILRRAMGKKKPEEMAKQRTVFTEGAAENGIDKKLAENIFDLIEKFAGYGFNKSHSAAYALIAYQTAWLKAHYPAEFMAAVLSSDMDNTDKVVGFIDECVAMKLVVHPPDIAKGFYQFTVNDAGEIVYGLGAIKGVGEAVIQNIVEVREQDGPFANLFDFCQRLDQKKLTKRALEPLIRSGSMDGFGQERAVLFASIQKSLQFANQQHRNESLGQGDLFGGGDDSERQDTDVEYAKAMPWSEIERLQAEKSVLGYYISGHPLDTCRKELSAVVKNTIADLTVSGNNAVIAAGIILSVRTIITKRGKKMAIMTLEDHTGRLDVTLFSEVYLPVAEDLVKDAVLIVKGPVSPDEYTGGIKMVAETVMLLDKMRQQMAKRLLIQVKDQSQVDTVLQQLPPVIKEHNNGQCPIVLSYQSQQAGANIVLGDAWRVNPCSDLLNTLGQVCGAENVMLEY